MEFQKTLLLIKPNAVKRGLIGKIAARFEDRGFIICGMKLLWMDKSQAEELYSPHKGKGFYDGTVDFMCSSPIVAMVIGGFDAIAQARRMMGATDPREAPPGTIRGDFGLLTGKNCVHGSDSKESSEREIPIFFNEKEVLDYSRPVDF